MRTGALTTVYSLAAGTASAIGSVLISVQFWQATIIAAITGLLAAVGTIVGAVLAARVAAAHTAELARKVDDVKRVVGAARRSADKGGDS